MEEADGSETRMYGLSEGITARRPQNLATEAMERSGLYGLLATLFRAEPSQELLERLSEPPIRDVLEDLGCNLGEALSAEALAVEFTQLFLGPGNHVPPYGSVHVPGGSGNLWGRETAEFRRFIEASGFDYAEGTGMLPDHISVGLDFMTHLTRIEAAAWEEDRADDALNALRLQQAFMSKHLGSWTPTFFDKVKARASEPFYASIAELADRVLACEKDDLDRFASEG
jgi:TorA maturation chaperone TorD